MASRVAVYRIVLLVACNARTAAVVDGRRLLKTYNPTAGDAARTELQTQLQELQRIYGDADYVTKFGSEDADYVTSFSGQLTSSSASPEEYKYRCLAFLINPVGGGRAGAKFINAFRDIGVVLMQHIVPMLVLKTAYMNDALELQQGKVIESLYRWCGDGPQQEPLAVVVGGGDGTVKDAIKLLGNVQLKQVPIAILALGTGNDLAQVVNFKFLMTNTSKKTIYKISADDHDDIREYAAVFFRRVQNVRQPSPLRLPLWDVTLPPGAAFLVNDEPSETTRVMLNYLSVGIDGDLTCLVDERRKRYMAVEEESASSSDATQSEARRYYNGYRFTRGFADTLGLDNKKMVTQKMFAEAALGLAIHRTDFNNRFQVLAGNGGENPSPVGRKFLGTKSVIVSNIPSYAASKITINIDAEAEELAVIASAGVLWTSVGGYLGKLGRGLSSRSFFNQNAKEVRIFVKKDEDIFQIDGDPVRVRMASSDGLPRSRSATASLVPIDSNASWVPEEVQMPPSEPSEGMPSKAFTVTHNEKFALLVKNEPTAQELAAKEEALNEWLKHNGG